MLVTDLSHLNTALSRMGTRLGFLDFDIDTAMIKCFTYNAMN